MFIFCVTTPSCVCVCVSGGAHQPGAHEDDGLSEPWEGNSNKDPHAYHRHLNPKTYNFLTTWSRGLLEKLSISFPVCQANPHNLWSRQFYLCAHKFLSVDPVISRINILQRHSTLFIMHFNIILPPTPRFSR